MAKKKIAEEIKQEFKRICTSINNKDKTIPVIVGGTVENDKWVDPYDMTSEAIQAVRDYLFAQIENEDKGSGYQWEREDGKYVKLMLTIEDKSAEEASTDEAEVHEDADELTE